MIIKREVNIPATQLRTLRICVEETIKRETNVDYNVTITSRIFSNSMEESCAVCAFDDMTGEKKQ